MMFLAGLLAEAPAILSRWWKLAAGMILGALLCWPVASCQGRKDGRLEMQAAIERANTQALQQKARADELAAERRITDVIAVNRQEQELRNAIADTPDSAPDAVRIRLGCERLRAAGTSAAALPAACRPGG